VWIDDSERIQELADYRAGFRWLLPRRIVAGFGDYFQLAASNVPPHEFSFVDARQNILVSGNQQRGDVDGLEGIDGVWALGHATLNLSNILGRHLTHHSEGSVNKIRAGFARGLAQEARDHGLQEKFCTALKDIVGGLQTCVAGIRVIGGRFRVAQTQSRYAAAIFPPEFEKKITPNRDSDHWCASDVSIVHYAHYVGSRFIHGGSAFSNFRFAMTANIGQDQAVARGECVCDGHPEFVAGGEWVEQNDWRAIADNPVCNVSVVAAETMRGGNGHAAH